MLSVAFSIDAYFKYHMEFLIRNAFFSRSE